MSDWVKYNTHTAKNKKTHNTTINFIRKDATTATLAKMAKSFGSADILIAEDLAIQESTVYASNQKFSKVIIESKLLTAIKAITRGINTPYLIDNLSKDIKIWQSMLRLFLSFSIIDLPIRQLTV